MKEVAEIANVDPTKYMRVWGYNEVWYAVPKECYRQDLKDYREAYITMDNILLYYYEHGEGGWIQL